MVAVAMAIVAKSVDCDFFLFYPNDVDPINRKIHARVYSNGAWHKEFRDYPDVLNNDGEFLKTAVGAQMVSQIPYTYTVFGGKAVVFDKLSRDDFCKRFVIPYEIVNGVDEAMNFIERNPSIVLKPVYGNQGRSILKISRTSENNFEVLEDHSQQIFSDQQLRDFLTKILTRAFVAQRFINSRTASGIPFDVRVHIQRGKLAKWFITKIYVRLGLSKAITSNIAGGGGLADAKPFLISNFGEELGADIYKRLEHLGLALPEKLQRSYQHNIDAIGLDVGIEPDGALYIFEVNSGPGSKFLYLEHAIHAIDYAKSLAENPKLAYPRSASD